MWSFQVVSIVIPLLAESLYRVGGPYDVREEGLRRRKSLAKLSDSSMTVSIHPTHEIKIPAWQLWLEHPEKLRVHRPTFQIHLWVGMLAGLYIFVMSVSGSAIVYRNALEGSRDPQSKIFRLVEWLVDLHENLLLGTTGRAINGIGALSLTLLCV